MSITGISVTKNNVANLNGLFGDVNVSASTDGSTIFGFETPVDIDGTNNTIYGYRAAQNMARGTSNTLLGYRAGAFTSDSSSTAIGAFAAEYTRGAANVSVGARAAQSNVSGTDNTFIGTAAGCRTSGSWNVGIGSMASTASTDGNVSIGGCNTASGSGSVCIGFASRNDGASSIVIGNNVTNDAASSVVLSTSSSGTVVSNAGTIFIGDRLVGSYSGRCNSTFFAGLPSNPYEMLVKADVVGVGPSLSVTPTDVFAVDASIGLRSSTASNAWWRFTLGPDATTTGDYTYANLTLSSGNSNTIVFTDEFCPDLFNFTAKHRCDVLDLPDREEEDPSWVRGAEFVAMTARLGPDLLIGRVVVATGKYRNLDGVEDPTIDEALPIVELCSVDGDSRTFGVIAGFEDARRRHRTFRLGTMRFNVSKAEHPAGTPAPTTVVVNSLGEGGIWVCDKNGDISNGDLLTTSSILGFAMRQEGDSVLRAHTVAKITCDCRFGSKDVEYGTARVRFVGCTYR